MTVFAYNSNTGAVAVVVQQDGVRNGKSILSIRDQLVNRGFDNALLFDGSDSSTLIRANSNGQTTTLAKPGTLKNRAIPVGLLIVR